MLILLAMTTRREISSLQQPLPGVYHYIINDQALVTAIIMRYQSLTGHESTRKSHHFGGRFENIYPDPERFPEMRSLETLVLQLTSEIHKTDVPMKLGYWFNEMGPGHTTSLHTHEENEELMSGVFYLQVPEKSGDIVFMIGGERRKLTSRVGDLFLFSPALPHAVEENRSQEIRLSVAFNIGPRH